MYKCRQSNKVGLFIERVKDIITFLTLILIQCKNYHALANAHHIVGLLATARGPLDFDMSHHTSMAQIIGLTGPITLWSPSDCTSFKKGNENV